MPNDRKDHEMPIFPDDRPLSDPEIALAVARAILDDRQNPGQNLPFQPHTLGLLARLGVSQRTREEQAWRQKFIESNREPSLDFRMAEYCWRLVGLGYLVPRMGGDWGQFEPTARGRRFLSDLDPAALTPGGLDQKLAGLGYAPEDLPRQYAGQAQDCFLAGHYEAAVVMLGVASESLVNTLGDSLSRVRPSVMPSLKARPSRSTARQDIEWLTEALATQHRRELTTALTSKGADPSSIETLRDLLTGTCQAIRLTRNEYGHPTGFTATQDDALPLLVLLPRFAEACFKATSALAVL